MSLETRLITLAQSVAADIKVLTNTRGSLAALTTSDKTSLVASINELKTALATAGMSEAQVDAKVSAAITALIGGAPGTLDTLKELADASADLAALVGNRVRFDAAQTLTAPQQATACANIGIGNPDTDLVAIYAAAKA